MYSRLTVIALTALLAVSCSKKNKNSYNLNDNETLRIALQAEPPSLDWSKSTDTTSALIQDNIMDGLVEYDLKDPDLGLKPALAEKWEIKGKPDKWVFTLRKDVKWTDGTALSAQHVVDGWERLLNPLTASEYAYFLYSVKNAREYNEGKIKDFSQVGVKINDKGQVEVQLVGPQSYFPYLLTHHCTYPVRKDVVKKFGDQWTDPKNIQTLGSFKLTTWDHDKAVVLTRNDQYYGKKPSIKHVLAYIVKKQQTALNLFDTKKIDAVMSLPSVELSQLKKRPEYRDINLLGIYYLGFNVKKAPMDNLQVRKAIAMAVDRGEITKMLAGGQIPMSSWVPPGMFGHEPDRGVAFNIKTANKLLDEAGYKDRSKFPKITIGFNTNEDHKRVMENVQFQLKKNLGISIELTNEEWKVYLNTLKVDPPHIFRMGWIADYPDPDNFLNLMTSFSDNNHTNWGAPEFDSLIKKAVTETSKESRRSLYKQAQQVLLEKHIPVAPIYAYVSQLLVSDRVENYPVNTMQRYKYKNVKLKK